MTYHKCLLQIYDLVEQINEVKVRRDFFLGFSQSPVEFIQKWLVSQSADLKVRFAFSTIAIRTLLKAMRGEDGADANSEATRRGAYYVQPALEEAVHRYYYAKVQQRRAELEQQLGIRNC